jgi:hypothetical protein
MAAAVCMCVLYLKYSYMLYTEIDFLTVCIGRYKVYIFTTHTKGLWALSMTRPTLLPGRAHHKHIAVNLTQSSAPREVRHQEELAV